MTLDTLWAEYITAVESRNELCEMQSRAPGETVAESEAELDKERQRRETRRKSAQQLVLGHPDSFDCVRCWMIDAVGTASECCAISPQLIEEMEEMLYKD
jgi:hypothetical protein